VVINEITAHVIGALSTDPDVETIFEIGGQDSKFVRLRGGNVVDSNMNYICAAGTGSFVEEQAGKLGFKVSEVGARVMGIVPPPTSDRCTVFMEQDVNALIRRGYSPEEAMAGVMRSVVQNYLNKVVGRRTVSKSKIAFMGATARNKGLVAAFEQQMGCPIVVSPYCHVMGAYGVSLAVRAEKADRPAPTTFRGLDLVRRKVELRHETCDLCNNSCRITHAHIEGDDSVPSWGYLCGRDPDEKKAKIRREYDLFRKREKLLRQAGKGVDVPENAPVIGLPMSLTSYTYRPLWTRFFNELGFRVVTSVRTDGPVKERALELVSADFCFPVKLVYGHVDKLLKKEGVDHVFLPHLVANELNDYTTDAQFCPWVQGMPSAVKTAFRQYGVNIDPVLSPVIDFRWTDRMLVDSLVESLGPCIGRGRADLQRAWRAGLKAQRSFERACVIEGKRGLRKLRESGKQGIVVLGRPYNVYDAGANVGLPEKIAEYGYTVVPVDFLPFRPELIGERYRNTFWNYGQRILSALRQIREDDSLYPVYLTNFSCGPDSFLLSYAEDIMGDKPLLILELDEHGADAGYITRVEAFLDVIRADRPEERPPRVDVFAPPTVWAERRVWVPPMHELGSELFAATFRRFGYRAEALPAEDLEAFDLGRRLTRGSECLPTAATLGTFVKTLRELDADPRREALFMPTAEGPCRFGQYATSHRLALEKIGMNDIAILSPSSYNSYQGLPGEMRRFLWDAILVADILYKMGCKVRPYEVEPGRTDEVLHEQLMAASRSMEAQEDLRDSLVRAMSAFAAVETRRERKPLVGVVGEIYVRCNGFCNGQVVRSVERYGGEGWLAPVSEWILYTSEMAKRGARIGINANLLRSPFAFITLHLKDRFLKKKDRHYHEVVDSFLHDRLEPHVGDVVDAGEHYIPLAFEGESILTVGRAIKFVDQGASLIVSANPFGCMHGVLSDACLAEVQSQTGVPVVTMFYDGEGDLNRKIGIYLANIRDRRPTIPPASRPRA
jgi:predicted nucleotide-binding protein (sugar kinase/HSP70/actin superfamily)